MEVRAALGLGLVLVLGVAAAPAPVRADCALMTKVRAEAPALHLGTFTDPLGHRASFYLATDSGAVLGPIDHQRWEDGPARPVTAPVGAAGAVGTLVYDGWVAGAARPSQGLLQRFVPGGAIEDEAALRRRVEALSDPFVLGLLAGQGPAQTTAMRKVEALDWSRGEQRAAAAAAMVGLLYAAPRAAAEARFAATPMRDVAGADLGLLLALRHGGLAELATRTVTQFDDWTDFVPALRTAWRRRPSLAGLTTALDDLAAQHGVPTTPRPEADASPLRDCAPRRAELRGPFRAAHEFTAEVVLAMIARGDPAFARALTTTLRGLALGDEGTVLALGASAREPVLLTSRDGGRVMAVRIDAARRAGLVVGTPVRFVARLKPGRAKLALAPHLSAQYQPAEDLGGVTRLTAAPPAPAALIAALRTSARSGGSWSGALALSWLFELADRVPGWTLADARAHAWALPGNRYVEPWAWANAWDELLRQAVAVAPTSALADEVERALPTITARFAQGPGGKAVSVPGDVLRRFALAQASSIALRRVVARDWTGARRVLDWADGPLAALTLPGTTVRPEVDRSGNERLVLATARVLVDVLARRPATGVPPLEQRDHAARLLLGSTARVYHPALRRQWAVALARAGYPLVAVD
ncbi:MAG: hypothetical protein KA297_22245 [Kofleriaceae bacterium]|nr:hypothetical protein [Kofleriaceae bacterium]MBP6836420.1 hypothetical protein [Kofleriaceae bacterium]